MRLPVVPNISCDVYHSGNLPPAAPDVAGVRGYLREALIAGNEQGDAAPNCAYSHVLLVDLDVDIRDSSAQFGPAGGDWDRVYVPDKDGTLFLVRAVLRSGYNTGCDHRIVFLWRATITWPSSYC